VRAATARAADSSRPVPTEALLGLARTLISRSVVDACSRLDDAAALFRANGDLWGVALTLSTRGQLILAGGDPTQARRTHLEALAAAETIDDDHLRAQILDMLGLDAVAVGDLAGGRGQYAKAARLHTRLLDYEGSAYGLRCRPITYADCSGSCPCNTRSRTSAAGRLCRRPRSTDPPLRLVRHPRDELDTRLTLVYELNAQADFRAMLELTSCHSRSHTDPGP
jgi:hypothetical protein